MRFSGFRLSFAALIAVFPVYAQSGFDSAGYPPELVARLGLDREAPAPAIGTWLRVRGFSNAPLPSAAAPERDASIRTVREALGRLRAAGYRTACFLRWGTEWPRGVRAGGGGGNRAPLDLRDAFARARAFAETYGDFVDAWEFENEPDIGYFADNGDVVAAYYKAVALGLAAGREQIAGRSAVEGRRVDGQKSSSASQSERSIVDPTAGRVARPAAGPTSEETAASENGGDLGPETLDFGRSGDSAGPLASGFRPPASSVVVMPAMALPPGPYLEQWVRNGALSYTEGVNLHFYGYPEDYGAAHDRLREAFVAADGGAVKDPSDESRIRLRRINVESTRPDPRRYLKSWSAIKRGGDTGPETFDFGRFGFLKRRLPVFVTEWGYPRLDGFEAQTVAGRVRQWRFFRDGQRENRRREVAAPMAFYLSPYFEIGAKEFGLPMPLAERRAAHYGFVVASDEGGPQKGAEDAKAGGRASGFSKAGGMNAGGLLFSPEDFGVEHEEPWMRRIGERVGGGEASPALAWLMEEGRLATGRQASVTGKAGHFRSPTAGHPRPPWLGDWLLQAEAPSPVVIDFVAGEGTAAVKNFNGYLLSGGGAAGETGARSGRGRLVFYNFGSAPAEVEMPWLEAGGAMLRPGIPESPTFDALVVKGREESPVREFFRPWARVRARPCGEGGLQVTLAPGERREIAVELRVEGGHFTAHDASLAAVVRCGGVQTVSRWASLFYPGPDRHRPAEGRSFFFSDQMAKENRRWLETRRLATEELRPAPLAGSRWRATPGVTVEETATGWRFHVAALPGKFLSPVVVELPLPDDWAPWERGLMLSYNYRIAPASFALRTPLHAGDADATQRLLAAGGDLFESYLRTRTGALYSTQPRLAPTLVWQRYNQPAETLTAHFPGRLAAPLRVEQERPAALVFYFRPAGLPTMFEIEQPMLAHWRTPDGGR